MIDDGDSSSSEVNQFLHEKENGKIIDKSDAEKEKKYFRDDLALQKTYIHLNRDIISEDQIDNISLFSRLKKREEFDINITIPLYLRNISDEIIQRHVVMMFINHTILYDETMIDLFLAGAINQQIKNIHDSFDENGNRKFMIFIALSKGEIFSKPLSSILKSHTFKVSEIVSTNNFNINQRNWNQSKTHEEMRQIFRKHENLLNQEIIGEIRIVTSPNYILNYVNNIEGNSINYFLKIVSVFNVGEKNEREIVRLTPISLIGVNNNIYNDIKDVINFSMFFDRNEQSEKLKILPNILIGVIKEHILNQTIDVPVYTTKDYLKISIVVSFMNQYQELSEEKKIPIGSILFSKNPIINILKSAISIIKNKLINPNHLDQFFNTCDDSNIRYALSFNKTYQKECKMEERYPAQTDLKIADFKFHNSQDISTILENKRHLIDPPFKTRDGSLLFFSSNNVGFLSSESIKLNGKIWIDCYWQAHNIIVKNIFNRWQILFNQLSDEITKSSLEFYYTRDMCTPPDGMNRDVFNDIKSEYQQQFNPKTTIKRMIRFKIFHDLVKQLCCPSMNVDYHIFSQASKLIDSIESIFITNNENYNTYEMEKKSLDLKNIIHTECDNILSVAMKKIPIDVIISNISLEINLDVFFQFVDDSKKISPVIKNHLIRSLRMIDMFRENSISIIHFEIETFKKKYSLTPISSSSSSSSIEHEHDEDYQKFFNNDNQSLSEKTKNNVKIISIKNFNDIFLIK